jgi:hypothetical protein
MIHQWESESRGKIMKISRKIFVIALLVSISSMLLSLPAQAGTSCHDINATGDGQDLGGGTTQAQVHGGGLLQGTTVAAFVPTGLIGSVLSFNGTVTFTTNKATLTIAVVGSFDLASGAFNATGPVSASTGKLEGASGNLTFNGVESLTDGSFTETIDGQICVDLSP